MSKLNQIAEFQREHRWLSNFWPAVVTLDNVSYPSVENAYQAAKTTNPLKRLIFVDISSVEAKRQGRKLQLRADWPSVRLTIMEYLVWQKFNHGPLRLKLRQTGDAELIEGNYWHDTFWGVCEGVGENHLGKILMKIRAELCE
jgi:ribA/ribD-fused uncharacterized protein